MRPWNLPRKLGAAWAGVRAAWRGELSLRLELIGGAAWLGLLAFLGPTPPWWALNVLALALVLATELVNTAIERVCDRLHPARHEAIRMVKDCAAGAVLAAVVGMAVVAALTLASLAR